jgi:site-specific recombinase XerD
MESPDSGNPYSKHTIRAYFRIATGFVGHLLESGAKSLNEANSLVIRSYINESTKGSKKASRMLTTQALSTFLNWTWLTGVTYGNPVLAMKTDGPHVRMGGRPEKRLPDVLTRNEIEILTEHIHSLPEAKSVTYMAMIGFLLDTGVRASELANVTKLGAVSMIRQGYLRIVGKGNKERAIRPLNTYRDELIEYIKYREDEPDIYLFPGRERAMIQTTTIYSRVSSLLVKSGIGEKNQCGAHLLRHTAASLMLDSGMNIRQVQENLGHSSMRTTEVYLHLMEGHEQVAV